MCIDSWGELISETVGKNAEKTAEVCSKIEGEIVGIAVLGIKTFLLEGTYLKCHNFWPFCSRDVDLSRSSLFFPYKKVQKEDFVILGTC